MKKIRSILILGVLIISMVSTSAAIDVKNKQLCNKENNSPIADELDQFQTEQTEEFGIPVGKLYITDPPIDFCFQVAQSFIPTKKMLTRVELFVGRNSTASHPYNLAIREELTEDNIVEISLNPDEFIVENYSWIEFDFEDISVTIGETYYIVSYTENVTDNFYGWGVNNDSESYENGCAWISIDDGNTWTNESCTAHNDLNKQIQGIPKLGVKDNSTDMCFKTYGADLTTLEVEIVKTGIGVSFEISNIGDIKATNVEYEFSAKGGLLGLVNTTDSDIITEIDIDDSITIPIGPLLGIGPITITARAQAENALEVTDSLDAFLFIIFVL